MQFWITYLLFWDVFRFKAVQKWAKLVDLDSEGDAARPTGDGPRPTGDGPRRVGTPGPVTRGDALAWGAA